MARSYSTGRALYLRGLSFRRRDPSEVASADLAKIDVCWAAVAGLSVVDFIRAAGFQSRACSWRFEPASRSGSPAPWRWKPPTRPPPAARAARRTASLLRLADALAADVGQPYAQGMVSLAAGTSAYLEGRWSDARQNCDRAEQTFRDHCTGVAWERATAHSFALWSLCFQGEIAELSPALARALERGRRARRPLFRHEPGYVRHVGRPAGRR